MPDFPKVARKIGMVFQLLEGANLMKSPIYKFVSELHSILYQKRNQATTDTLEEILQKKMQIHKRIENWWNGEEEPIQKLVIIVDEVGKCQDFGRGLVDSVREIHQTYVERKKRCRQFKLVIAGSGLDAAIRRDSSVPLEEDPDIATFGTDPLKSSMAVLQGPKKFKQLTAYLEKYMETKKGSSSGKRRYIPEAIVEGSYSRVLATNTRMLFDGIIPILENGQLTEGIEYAGLQQRFLDLCSSNIVMDYAARKYLQLNGLKDEEERKRQKLLRNSFCYILQDSSRKAKVNQHAYDENAYPKVSALEKQELMLKGIVASDPSETSPALRYLACNGLTEELVPADGISFEGILAAHLRRFLYCGKELPVETYDLQEAWPPKSLEKLEDKNKVKRMFKRRFEAHDFIDVPKLCQRISKRLQSVKSLAIVMKQRVPSAQSADVIVLEASINEKKQLVIVLDLFQAKHFDNVPGVKSPQFAKWASSIGVRIPPMPEKKDQNDYSYLYSELGITYLCNCLCSSLEKTEGNYSSVSVNIRDRYIVVSKSYKETPWTDEESYNYAKRYGVRLWTREHLEPTISAVQLNLKAEEENVSITYEGLMEEVLLSILE
jgi:hypothetical protein